jgi:eukaryotic-like serine/threonine-protein kinase
MLKKLWKFLHGLLLTGLGLVLFGSVLLLVGYFGVGYIVGWGDEVIVPNLVGKESGEALELVLTARLEPVLPIKEDYHDEIEKGRIIEQYPMPGSRVKQGRQVQLTKSLGSQKVIVPQLVGLDLRSAEWEMSRTGFQLGRISSVYHDEREEGLILAQQPPGGSREEKGNLISLLLSDGPEPELFILPDVRGWPESRAVPVLKRIGIEKIETKRIERPDLPSGMIVAQLPASGAPLSEDQQLLLTVTTPDARQGEVQNRFFSYELPWSPLRSRVEVYILDDQGFRQLYRGRYSGSEPLEFIGQTVGNAFIVIYRDGQRVVEDYLFGES